jgi:hypothetical protein
MMRAVRRHKAGRGRLWAVPVAFALVISGCSSNAMLELSSQQMLSREVRAVLGTSRVSPEYQQVRSRLEVMGPEVDGILVDLVEDTRARTDARADALVLLADRRSPLALPILSRALGYENERLRSAAVLGLNRLAATSDDAIQLIRAATRDRSRTVRLNALQSLDISEVETIRALIERESDPEVLEIAFQLVSLAEARGAPLVHDRRGALRTAGDESDPQIVFRPSSIDSIARRSIGDLRLELPEGRDIPLAASAHVVREVVPAFFSPDRSAVVFEGEGQVQVLDIASRSIVGRGPGISPRLIPFTNSFVFLRQRLLTPTPVGSEVVYDVFLSSFASEAVAMVGEVRATLRRDTHGGESPVRWMVVSDSGDGFELRAEGMQPFQLRPTVWVTGTSLQGFQAAP